MKKSFNAIAIGSLLVFSACGGSKTDKSKKIENKEQKGTKNMSRVKTNSGLEYEIIQEGTGATAQAGQVVTVHYTGWLDDDGKPGAKFDSSVDRGTPFQFPLGAGHVIKGWDEGVASMKIGEKRRLILPADLGYGERGAGGVIPPNATLIFDVELLGAE
jgi:FKBP-type peptidyl-prolyl cis-trans isomerase FkpA